MSDAACQTQAGLEAQPPMPVRRLRKFIYCPRLPCSTEVPHTQAAAFNDALERADGDGFIAVHRYDHLPAIGVTPFLMTAFLAYHREAVSAQDSNNFLGVADWIAFAHLSATSNTLAPAGSGSVDGSNQSSKASFALRTASSSVSPAEAHPGNSGKTADHRFALGSCSTTSRSFMPDTVTERLLTGKATVSMTSPAPHPALSPPAGSGWSNHAMIARVPGLSTINSQPSTRM
jgi:hypothetical protein